MGDGKFDCAPPDPHPRPPHCRVPAGATDCHAHIIGPASRYPFVSDRSYTPPDALLADYLRVLRVLGLRRAVLVQPSMHGDDNTAMMNAIAEAKGVDLRAVVVVRPDVADAELAALHARGARGVRINLIYAGGNVGLQAAAEIAARIRDFGWHLQILADVSQIGDNLAQLSALPVPVVVDHFGHLPAARGIADKGFAALLELVRRGNAWVKLSAPYRLASDELPYADVRPFCEALVRASADRMLWGTDWPHTTCRLRMPNDGDLLDLICAWLGDEALISKVLVENPAVLYGFAAV
jgi:2-pyrone-4,6-dicarboxylate lactonase